MCESSESVFVHAILNSVAEQTFFFPARRTKTENSCVYFQVENYFASREYTELALISFFPLL